MSQEFLFYDDSSFARVFFSLEFTIEWTFRKEKKVIWLKLCFYSIINS